VRAGDLMRPRLGLGEDVFARLAEEIDAVVHDGALVNHALSYPQLFQPNVAGTAEVIRLALTARAKSVAYVSTVGVAGGLARLDAIREDEGARALFEERPIDHGYAVGYATSKWAGEVLMGELSARFGVPTAIFRCSMIMPPREGIGQVNAGDFFIRLLVGVIATGLAPRSFYAPGVGEHFDGLPVDFTAASIAAVALDPRPGSAVYHVVNPRWEEGVSLDTLVRWIGESGYAIRHVEEHARWYEAFVTELSALPPEVRARSPLPIVEQWARPLARGMRFDAARLRERLAALGAEAEMPALTRGYVEKVASDLAAAGLVARPLGRAA
jgi:fatty acid CoA ligase FadD9